MIQNLQAQDITVFSFSNFCLTFIQQNESMVCLPDGKSATPSLIAAIQMIEREKAGIKGILDVHSIRLKEVKERANMDDPLIKAMYEVGQRDYERACGYFVTIDESLSELKALYLKALAFDAAKKACAEEDAESAEMTTEDAMVMIVKAVLVGDDGCNICSSESLFDLPNSPANFAFPPSNTKH